MKRLLLQAPTLILQPCIERLRVNRRTGRYGSFLLRVDPGLSQLSLRLFSLPVSPLSRLPVFTSSTRGSMRARVPRFIVSILITLGTEPCRGYVSRERASREDTSGHATLSSKTRHRSRSTLVSLLSSRSHRPSRGAFTLRLTLQGKLARLARFTLENTEK